MTDYTRLALLTSDVKDGTLPNAWNSVRAYLTEAWLREYASISASQHIVETMAAHFYYLFDIEGERLIAAYGVSEGRYGGVRDKSRMAGHPLGAGPSYHRGHAIPHRLGGPTDINLVSQLGSVNIGAFR